MSAVTGPISSLPGSTHDAPENMKCDNHPRRKAVVRIQGETDSFGCEMHDLCDQCAKRMRRDVEDDRKGKCDWCKQVVTDLRDTRDYEEGLYGPVYRVCGACRKRRDDEARAEMDYYDDWDD